MPTLTYPGHERGARYIATFVALSLLIHGLLFFAFFRWPREDMPRPAAGGRPPLAVRLLPPAPAAPDAAPAPAPPVAKAVPHARPRPKPAPRIIARRKPSPAPTHTAKLEPPAPPAETRRAPEAEMDMLTMLNAARERRRAAQQSAAMEDTQPPAASENDIALANINRDLQRYSGKATGVGGVFRIISKGVRTAQFQFLGWNPGSGNSWHQTIEVDAGPNGDVELATVQKMIELIRSHYSGDFNWESHRLGRVLVLSARPSDNAALEAFLMREFFGS